MSSRRSVRPCDSSWRRSSPPALCSSCAAVACSATTRATRPSAVWRRCTSIEPSSRGVRLMRACVTPRSAAARSASRTVSTACSKPTPDATGVAATGVPSCAGAVGVGCAVTAGAGCGAEPFVAPWSAAWPNERAAPATVAAGGVAAVSGVAAAEAPALADRAVADCSTSARRVALAAAVDATAAGAAGW